MIVSNEITSVQLSDQTIVYVGQEVYLNDRALNAPGVSKSIIKKLKGKGPYRIQRFESQSLESNPFIVWITNGIAKTPVTHHFLTSIKPSESLNIFAR